MSFTSYIFLEILLINGTKHVLVKERNYFGMGLLIKFSCFIAHQIIMKCGILLTILSILAVFDSVCKYS